MTLDLATIVLQHGSHSSPDQGLCVMEAVAFFAGLPHSDMPECTDAVLSRAAQRLNDRWDQEGRQKLVQLIPVLVGTRGSLALSKRRAFFIVDRVVRSVMPTLLRELPHKPRPDLAERLESIDPIMDRASASRARDVAHEVRADADADAYAAADAAAYAAYAAADAAAYAAAYAYAADAAAAYAAYAAAERSMRSRLHDLMVEVMREACAMTEGSS